MTVGQKATVSLLASTLLAAGFAALAYSGLFSVIETRFFDERVKRSVNSSVQAISASADAYHALNAERFSGILGNDYVRRSFLPNQSARTPSTGPGPSACSPRRLPGCSASGSSTWTASASISAPSRATPYARNRSVSSTATTARPATSRTPT